MLLQHALSAMKQGCNSLSTHMLAVSAHRWSCARIDIATATHYILCCCLFFHRDQWQWEGGVVALQYIAAAASVLIMSAALRWRRVPTVLRSLAVCCCIAVICLSTREFLKLYKVKTQWYDFTQVIPRPVQVAVQRWIGTGKVNAKSPYLHRVVRVCDIWLNEYSGVKQFAAQFKRLLINPVLGLKSKRIS
jgi:hypothetical protein